MKRFLTLALLLVGLSANEAMAAETFHHITVKGKVTDNSGKGVAGVPVTDGRIITTTDKKGNYSLPTLSDRDYIYYTLPSGYNSDTENCLPRFYKKLDKTQAKQTIDFSITKATVDQTEHNFIIWADPQVYQESEFALLKEVVDDIKATAAASDKPFHAISAGDNVFDRHYLLDDYIKTVSGIGMPFYHVIGNHDRNYNERSNEGSNQTYEETFGPSHYAFNVGNIHYVVLDDIFYYGYTHRYIGYVTEEQLSWLEQDLALVPQDRKVVVSVHIPTMPNPYIKGGSITSQFSGMVMNNSALYDVLKGRNVHIMAGHSHEQWNTQVNGHILEHVHAAASGAWWQGEVSTDGCPKGYTVYEVKGDSLSWYFKGLNLPKEEQFRLYEKGDTLYANVFNYDETWKVEYYEDGKYIGDMVRYTGVDPIAEGAYQPGRNKTHRWLGYAKTGHLFKAPKGSATATKKVVATDRFGNKYTKTFSPYRLVWSDEFDKDGLPDDTKWSYDTDGNAWRWGNNEAQFYTAGEKRNAYVSDGTLKIVALKEKKEDRNYTSARLVTKGKGDWKYGKVVVRAKLPAYGRGSWPAIWMLPTENVYGGWPKSGEIDIMENVGYACDSIYSTAHTHAFNHTRGNQRSGALADSTFVTDFHVYTLEWDEISWRTYVDGKFVYEWKNDYQGWEAWPFDQKFHLILNLAIGGNWGGKHGIDDSKFPKTMEVDYVRVYQRND